MCTWGTTDEDVQLLYVPPLPQGQQRVLIGFRGEEGVHAQTREESSTRHMGGLKETGAHGHR